MVGDLQASKRFYPRAGVLGIPMGGESDDYCWADELFVSSKDSKAALRRHDRARSSGIQATDRSVVDRFRSAAIGAEGKAMALRRASVPCRPPTLRSRLDPGGNNIEVVFHGLADRSAQSVKITFAA